MVTVLVTLAVPAPEARAIGRTQGAAIATEITFAGAGGIELRGTLLMPAARTGSAAPASTAATAGRGTGAEPGRAGLVPAMLLLPGSGPTDRNGNQPPALVTDLLKQIAESLAAAGIATLRFDKRAAHVYAAIWPKDIAAIDEFFSYENFVADATAAYRRLRATAGVDPDRVAILGHSEGGLFALQIARDLAAADERPAGVILAAAAGRVLDDVIREQIGAALARQTKDEALRRSFLDQLERGIAAVKAGEPIPADLPPGLTPVINRSVQKLLKAYFTVDPAALAASVRGPVLILQGLEDAQISAERDAPRLADALRNRAGSREGDVTVALISGASHNFKQVAPDTAPGAAAGFTGPVVDDALRAVADWSRRVLASVILVRSRALSSVG